MKDVNNSIYIVQFGTGATINLLPLAAGQLVSRLRQEQELLQHYVLKKIVFKRGEAEEIVRQFKGVAIIGFSCFLWNYSLSLKTAAQVRKLYPDALIVLGGPAIPKSPDSVDEFFREQPSIDIICAGEGEEVLVEICKAHNTGSGYDHIPGLILRDIVTGRAKFTAHEVSPCLDCLPSPYLDGTFDGLYDAYQAEFSGICWETNRGCPYHCTFCTWGNLPSHAMREKPLEQVKAEIEWIGKHAVNYVAMADSNFGIRPRDVEIARMLAKSRRQYGYPRFISVSWAKNSTDKIIEIGNILKSADIGFRVTLALQSLKPEVVEAVNRTNYRREEFCDIKKNYFDAGFYTYTELILGLPLETVDSFLDGIENCLSGSLYEQIYVYPLFLFPNTEMSSKASRQEYGLVSRIVPNRYTKSKEVEHSDETVEIVVGTGTMPEEAWRDAFVAGYFTLALHDDRIMFFVLRYLKEQHGIRITDFTKFTRFHCRGGGYSVVRQAFERLETTALSVQEQSSSHLVESEGLGGVPFDPSDGVFLELIQHKHDFVEEMLRLTTAYLHDQKITIDSELLCDLFLFQEVVMAAPSGPGSNTIGFNYDWTSFFLSPAGSRGQLVKRSCKYSVIDERPSNGSAMAYLKNHFDVRGVPPFNLLIDSSGNQCFPACK
ncbi:B12-binding domain-containing radical SAM protein [Trichlorobacter lovleyi]|uniref:B12-binding domain-containing radical SAM protein n=1 Tax=Trichlorobacter lovleyi TaxID=313985 RepID=UPI0023F44B20|nr:radical SAM protein [Trichlorobacter lovleyi]